MHLCPQPTRHLAPLLTAAALIASAAGASLGWAQPPAETAPATAPTGTPAPAPARESTPDLPTARPAKFDPSAQNKPAENEITPDLDVSVTKGLSKLAAMQNDDGTFGAGRFGRNVAITALAGLALMADGHVPGRGQYGPNVEKALKNILENANETGLIAGDSNNGPMYGHGFATLFLGEVYGMTGGSDDSPLAKRTHEALVRAVRLIERTQNEEGGWRYNPVPFDADVSITICQIMALRSARNAGIEVPKETIDKAIAYVRKCQNPDGGFMYQTPSGLSAWPRSAAGVASLYYAGVYEGDAIDKGIKYLVESAPAENRARAETHYWYGVYYTAQSMYLAGGSSWAGYWPSLRSELLARQTADGLWSDNAYGPSYSTAMALIVLQMPKRYLPIFQK